MLSSYKGIRTNRTAKNYPLPDVAQVVIDPDTQRRYFRGRLLGKVCLEYKRIVKFKYFNRCCNYIV